MAQIHIEGVWTKVWDPSHRPHFHGLDGTSNTITWGDPVSNGQTSSYEFVGGGAHAEIDGPSFALGEFTHHNYPIYLPFERFKVDLEVTVNFEGEDLPPFTLTFEHYESPNQGPIAGQADQVTLPDVIPPKDLEAVQINGVACVLKVDGFYVPHTNRLTHKFRTPEGKPSSADIHVQLTSYTGPR
ncbi:choice-of-anchor K domain-containing protein [Streptomyces litchfieldiae]|uniref:Choice-of-anchor K domain-containing protein n=1 Tax=Streptomyces litchfieldiae TaxID=3075543 RepID=A0ABU2MRX7_9ACTN|nr:choice-of-anchor K domain-containing protein [Streptomyces sp. DSM 44938]MDT0344388.1 choice-of-anchor K domain-containing protein [Streptomyces sp. DSM 44938]